MIGCGTLPKKNGPDFTGGNSKLDAIYNRTEEKALDGHRRTNNPMVCKSAQDLLPTSDRYRLYCYHTDVHREYSCCCAQAKKHIYIEKPITHTYEMH